MGNNLPPRILAPGFSLWLPEGARVELIHQSLAVYNAGGECRLRQPQEPMVEVIVGGQPPIRDQVLRDGDFIYGKKERFIFQADPIADRRGRLTEVSQPQALRAAKPLRGKLRADATGFSLDKGRTWTRWEEVDSLVVVMRTGKYSGGLWLEMLIGGQRLRSDRVNAFELRRFLKRASEMAPIDLSIVYPPGWWRLPLTDAYVLASRRLLQRAESGYSVLPSLHRRFVLGESFQFRDVIRSLVTLLGSIGLCVALAIVTLAGIQNARSSELVDATGALTAGGAILIVFDGFFVLLGIAGVLYGLKELFRTLTVPLGE
ncbi:MAG: hypothetical protein JW918_02545 [Anaerolineae bacterium]|nr:hypothetical protein [Anaerolineae bacterium]